MIDRSCPYNLLLYVLCTDPLASDLVLAHCYSVTSSIPGTSVCLPQCHPRERIWYLVLLVQVLL